jgi:hypothetical protein
MLGVLAVLARLAAWDVDAGTGDRVSYPVLRHIGKAPGGGGGCAR